MTYDGFAGTPPLAFPPDMIFGRPNCGLVALAVCTGTPLARVTEWYRFHHTKRGNWKGKVMLHKAAHYFAYCGVWTLHARYKNHKLTIGKFVEYACKPDTTYLLSVSGHAVTVRNGWVLDQYGLSPVHLHSSRKRRVVASWEIVL